MTTFAICQFVRFVDKMGDYIVNRSYQNFFPEERYDYLGVVHDFAPYLVKGATSTKGGDNSSASIVTIPNDLTVSLFTEAVASRWLAQIKTVLIDIVEGAGYTIVGQMSNDIWACTNCIQDFEKVEMVLSSPIDAVKENVPKRVLSSYLVGSLPPTGSILSK